MKDLSATAPATIDMSEEQRTRLFLEPAAIKIDHVYNDIFADATLGFDLSVYSAETRAANRLAIVTAVTTIVHRDQWLATGLKDVPVGATKVAMTELASLPNHRFGNEDHHIVGLINLAIDMVYGYMSFHHGYPRQIVPYMVLEHMPVLKTILRDAGVKCNNVSDEHMGNQALYEAGEHIIRMILAIDKADREEGDFEAAMGKRRNELGGRLMTPANPNVPPLVYDLLDLAERHHADAGLIMKFAGDYLANLGDVRYRDRDRRDVDRDSERCDRYHGRSRTAEERARCPAHNDPRCRR